MVKVYKPLLTIVIIFIIFNCSTDSDSSLSETNNSASETFGSWSPSFTDQKTNFDQTRNGSNGSQQTRTITVSYISNNEVTTENILNQDINEDDDLFDEIEKVITTYTASENLGSYQEITFSLTEDNNNGVTIGNNFYPIHNGALLIYRVPQDEWLDNGSGDDLTCNGFTLLAVDLFLYSNDLSYSRNYENGVQLNSESGGGKMVFMEMLSIYPNDISLNDGVVTKYYDYYDIINQNFGTSFNLQINSSECSGFYNDEVEDEVDRLLPGFNDSCSAMDFVYQTTTASYYDVSYNSDVRYQGADYCEGIGFDTIGSPTEVIKNQDDTYIIKIIGKDEFSLPMKLYYNGFLAIDTYVD